MSDGNRSNCQKNRRPNQKSVGRAGRGNYVRGHKRRVREGTEKSKPKYVAHDKRGSSDRIGYVSNDEACV
jgi:hypothetical protein